MASYSSKIFDRYLELIGVDRSEPSPEGLTSLTSAHLIKVPFENVSKIYRTRIKGIREIPQLNEFLDGIEYQNFGGTCYTNNYYLHLLLGHLGYRVRLCGADISVNGAPPDGHMVNIVTIEGREVIADVGYGAPFWKPIPRDSKIDWVLKLGFERYVLKPQDNEGRSRLELYRNNQLRHGYVLKPAGRQFGDFADVIARSCGEGAPFLNRLLLVRFFENQSLILRNHTLSEMSADKSTGHRLETRDEIIQAIEDNYGISADIAAKVLKCLGDLINTDP